jgi:hypothetical protein
MRPDGGFNQLNETPFRPSSRSEHRKSNFVSFQWTLLPALFSEMCSGGIKIQQVAAFNGCMTYHLFAKRSSSGKWCQP